MRSRLALGILFGIALLLGLGFVFYYGLNDPMKPSLEKIDLPGKDKDNNANYFSKIRVEFTNQVYPNDEYQTNPRLRRYIGKVQNAGNRTVTHLVIRIEYLDKNDKPIREENIRIDKALKANFIEEFTFGGIEVPSDWNGKVKYEITELRFEGSAEIQHYNPNYYSQSPFERSLQEIILFP